VQLLGARYSVASSNPADLAEAYYWYSVAALGGNRAAEAFRNSAGRKLTLAQREAVARRLKGLKASGDH
jgi:TPR repeat protein